MSDALHYMLRALLLVLLSPLALAQQETPFARLIAEGDATTVVGEALYVRYEVWVPSWFFGAPAFPDELNAAGAISEMIKGSLLSEFRVIGEQRWTGLIRRYRLTPLQAGNLLIQPGDLSVRYADAGAQPLQTRISVVEPLSITATIPSGAEALTPFIAARLLSLSQAMTPSGVGVRVGDAVERRISLVTDNPLPQLPDLQFVLAEGASVVASAGQSQGTVTGPSARGLIERVALATYQMQREGEVWLPAISIAWWDLDAQRLRTTELPALRIDVLPAPAWVDPFCSGQGCVAADRPKWHWALVLLVIGMALLWRRYKPWRELHWRVTELCCRLRLLQACRQNDALIADAALRRWAAAIAPGKELRLLGDPALSLERDKLDEQRFASQLGCAPWQGMPLYRAACRARKCWRRDVKGRRGKRLPTLQP